MHPRRAGCPPDGSASVSQPHSDTSLLLPFLLLLRDTQLWLKRKEGSMLVTVSVCKRESMERERVRKEGERDLR